MLSISSRRLRCCHFSMRASSQLFILHPTIKLFNQSHFSSRHIVGNYNQLSREQFSQTELKNFFGRSVAAIKSPSELTKPRFFSSSRQLVPEDRRIIENEDYNRIQFDQQYRRSLKPWYRTKKFYFLIFCLAFYSTYKFISKFFGKQLASAYCDLILEKISQPSCVFYLRCILAFSPDTHVKFMDKGGVDLLLDGIQQKFNKEEEFAAIFALMYLTYNTPAFEKLMLSNPNILPSMMEINKNLALARDVDGYNKTMECLSNLSGMEIFRTQFIENKGLKYLCDLYPIINTAPVLANFLYKHPKVLEKHVDELTPSERKIILASLRASNKISTKPMYQVNNLRQQLILSPSDSEIISKLGVQYKKLGQEASAKKYFEDSLKIDPCQTEAAYNYAVSIIKDQNDHVTLAKAAKILYVGLAGLRQHKLESVTLPITSNKKSEDTRQNSKNEMVDESTALPVAIPIEDTGLEKSKEYIRPKITQFTPIATKAYSLIVKICQQLGELELALDQAQEWVSHCDTDPYAHINYGCLLARLGRYKEALPSLRRTIHLQPDTLKAHKTLGQCLYKLGHVEESIASYNEAIRLANSNSDNKNLTLLYHEYGGLLYKSKLWKEALEIFTLQSGLHSQAGFMKKYQDIPRIANMNPEYKRACCLEKLHHQHEAYTAFTKALDSKIGDAPSQTYDPSTNLVHVLKAIGSRCKVRPLTSELETWEPMCSKYYTLINLKKDL